ncbi:MAG: DUF2079 domain-containing protein [Spirulina sp. SIO3F2]|nr:DUF2079 domain-containing protein [Spirulina sp. SIO3F2]
MNGQGARWRIGICATLMLFGCSSLRHWLFKSNALDLGWFDQAVYLISRGQPPIVSFSGYHILGDHVAWLFYPIALLYRLYPDVHWLFAIQVLALAAGGAGVWYLARQAGLDERRADLLTLVYALYPLVFNINLFDFHLDVLVIPGVLWAVWAVRANVPWLFGLAIALILGSKAVLALTVVGLGLWLVVGEKRPWYGAIALFSGMAWFILATQVIAPHFAGAAATAEMTDGRYAHLGSSIPEIVQTLLLKPHLGLQLLFSLPNLEYLLLLCAPLFWIFVPRHLSPLIGAAPALLLNLLTPYQAQKDLVHQYSAPILPFLLLIAIAVLAAGQGWLRRPRWILTWSAIGFVALAKYGNFAGLYLETWDTAAATRAAIAQVPPHVPVLTLSHIAPHLTHRATLQLATEASTTLDPEQFQAVLLDTHHPGWGSSPEVVQYWVEQLTGSPQFEMQYHKDGVMLFGQN